MCPALRGGHPGQLWPDVDVIVAVHNEAQLIAGKIADVFRQRYPGRLRLIVVDGGSTDGTLAHLASAASREPRLESVTTSLASKCAQLNEGLARGRARWVLVTDADGRLPPDTIARLVAAASADPAVAVVGTALAPSAAHPLEVWHWRLVNRLRQVEARVGTSGLVLAPCYLFRRSLLDRFPEDAAADDVYIACRAAEQGARVAIADVAVRELRTPATGAAWIRQKTRRTRGYLHEIVRFAPHLGRMPWPSAVCFLWRALALTAAPALAAIAVATTALTVPPTALAGAGAVIVAAGYASLTARRESRWLNLLRGGTLPAWWLVIALAALALSPFVRATTSYGKLPLVIEDAEVC